MEYKDRTIDIFGSKWKLKFVDKIDLEDDSNPDGITDANKRLIAVSTNQSDNEVMITLLHELIHAILNTGQYLNSSQNEPMVEFVARSLYSLTKQRLIQWKF